MKNIWKYILIGLGTIALEWIFLAVFATWFNGMGELGGIIIGAAFFLAFEIVICTGAIISKIENNKKNQQYNKFNGGKNANKEGYCPPL